MRSTFSCTFSVAQSGISRTIEYISKCWFSAAEEALPNFASSSFNLSILYSVGKVSFGRLSDENCLLNGGTSECSLFKGSPSTSLNVPKNLSVFSASRVITVNVPRGPSSFTSSLKP